MVGVSHDSKNGRVNISAPSWAAAIFLSGLIGSFGYVTSWAVDMNEKVLNLDNADLEKQMGAMEKRMNVLERQNSLLQQEARFTSDILQEVKQEQRIYQQETNKKLDILIQRLR
jgi:cell division protein FtsB